MLTTTKVGVAPGTATFQLGDPLLCDRGAKARIQRRLYLPTLYRAIADKVQDACAALAPSIVEPAMKQPTATTQPPMKQPHATIGPATVVLPVGPTMSTNVPIGPRPTMSTGARAYSPYASLESLKGGRTRGGIRGFLSSLAKGVLGAQPTVNGLGYVLDVGPTASGRPYAEVVQTGKNYGPNAYCGTYDKSYHTRGTPGLYYDTQMGGIPSDLQMSRIRNYTPVMSSWVPFQNQTWAPPPWVPPNGTWTPEGIRPVGPRISPLQLGDGEAQPPYDAGQAAIAELKRHQDRVFALSVVSTMAIASTAVINILKHLEDAHKLRKRNLEPGSMTAPIAGARRRGRR